MEEYDVVILGAGYAGLICALRLAGRMRSKPFRLALISRRPDFVERLRLHEQISAADAWPLAARLPPLPELASKAGFTFIEGSVTGLDRTARTVAIASADAQTKMRYRQLVVALGSEVDRTTAPGVAAHAFTLDPDGPHSQLELRKRLLFLPQDAPIVIAGGGATGIEIASNLACSGRTNITLVENGKLGAFATPPVMRHIRSGLARTGVLLMEHTRVTAVERDGVITGAGALPAALCVWCGGFTAGDGLRGLGLALDRSGRLPVDPYLRTLEDSNVFAAGDACIPVAHHGAPSRRSAFFALTTGAHVADTVAALVEDRKLRPFGYWTWGQAISVGTEAVGYATIPHDRQVGPIYRGRYAFWLRWFFVWFLARILLLHLRWPRLPFWIGKRSWRRAEVRKFPVVRQDGAAEVGRR